MINLDSVIDGFRVIIGGFILNLVALVTIIIAVRPPEYEDDEELTHTAFVIYITLLVNHLTLAAVRYLSLFQTRLLRDYMVCFMIVQVVIVCILSQRFIYTEDLRAVTKTQE